MPIPVRSHSPTKQNSAGNGPSSTTTGLGTVPHAEAPGTKELTRLTREAASARATSKVSARTVTEPKPDNPSPATKVPDSNTRGEAHAAPGPTRNHLSASSSGATRTAPAVSGLAVATVTSRPQWTSNRNAANVRAQVLSSHRRALSATIKPRRTAETRDEAGKASLLVPSHALSSTTSKASLSGSEKAVRSNFSTDQQHYSPKKSSSVPVASGSAPNKTAIRPGFAGRVIPAAEVETLQDELLQLSIVQVKSSATLQAYRASIKSQLRASFEAVAKELSLLKSRQRDRQKTVNALSVSEWLQKKRQTPAAAYTGCDTLLLLAHCQRELQDASKENGPLKDAMKIFDEWCVYTSSRRSNRPADALRDGDSARNLENFFCPSPTVAERWSASFSSAEGRVGACVASWTDLQQPSESTSIGLLIKMQTILAEQILQEIGMCRSIEGLIVREEQEWVRTAVEAALQDAELHHPATAPQASVRRGIWDTR
ncbi:hypothetical protein PV04_10595 [Phialophora macrospora]|uniref:Uncharacterized protein n=1 Tax=Phialophora macrospora TaxID=1851006 RepID=A0A0D2DJ72_9EURO|nr:hypothetical protein PV04_10595 [Phialophora macrospora]